jgi:hypothetical protein
MSELHTTTNMRVHRSGITQAVGKSTLLEAGAPVAGDPVADSVFGDTVGNTVGDRVGHAVVFGEVGSVTVGLHRHDAESRWYICIFISYIYIHIYTYIEDVWMHISKHIYIYIHICKYI